MPDNRATAIDRGASRPTKRRLTLVGRKPSFGVSAWPAVAIVECWDDDVVVEWWGSLWPATTAAGVLRLVGPRPALSPVRLLPGMRARQTYSKATSSAAVVPDSYYIS